MFAREGKVDGVGGVEVVDVSWWDATEEGRSRRMGRRRLLQRRRWGKTATVAVQEVVRGVAAAVNLREETRSRRQGQACFIIIDGRRVWTNNVRITRHRTTRRGDETMDVKRAG
jgi:hypothetical protein